VVEVSTACDSPLNVDHIRQQIRDSAGFKKEMETNNIDASCIDFENSHILCRGAKISNVNISTLLPAQTLSLGEKCAAAAPVVWKISAKAAEREGSPPPTQQPASSHRSDLTKFCSFLRETNVRLLKDFFVGGAVAGDISSTRVFRIASRIELLNFDTAGRRVDSIEHCIRLLSELKISHELYVARRKALNKEELGIQKYALDNGKVQRLNLHKTHPKLFDELPPSPHAQACTPRGCASDTTSLDNSSSNSKANRRLAWTYSERLHHKLHDMLMFDIAELELDGNPYKGKGDAQNPKRDPQHSEKLHLKKLTAQKGVLEQMISDAREFAYESLQAQLQGALDATLQLLHALAEPAASQPNARSDRWFSKENAWCSPPPPPTSTYFSVLF
jgi:hypothetical protein